MELNCNVSKIQTYLSLLKGSTMKTLVRNLTHKHYFLIAVAIIILLIVSTALAMV